MTSDCYYLNGDRFCKYETRGQIFVSSVAHRFVLRHCNNYLFSIYSSFLFRKQPVTRFDTSHVPHVSTRAMCHTFQHEPCATRFDTSHVPLVSTRAMCHTFRHEPCATRFDTSHVPHVSTRAMCHCQTFTEIRVMRTKMCCALIHCSKYNMTILCRLLVTEMSVR